MPIRTNASAAASFYQHYAYESYMISKEIDEAIFGQGCSFFEIISWKRFEMSKIYILKL